MKQAPVAGMDPERLASIPIRMKAFVENGTIAGAVTLVARHGFLHFKAQGNSDSEEANALTRRTMPIFGDPRRASSHESEDDRPLPRELKNRVSSAAMILGQTASEQQPTSMNAVVREFIRTGRL